MNPLLVARDLRRTFLVPGRVPIHAVRGVSLQIDAGEVVGLVGESGSGKTTLGKLILRLIPSDSGSVLFDGIDLHRQGSEALRRLRRRVQYIPQNASAALNPQLTVRAHLRETIELHRPGERAHADETIDRWLARFQLHGRADRLPGALSGGERRRVAVLRALLPEPDLVIADEPTAGLDASVKAEVLDLMLGLRERPPAWLFITHELDVVRYAASRVLVLLDGTLIEDLPSSRLRPQESGLHPYTEHLVRSGFDRAGLPARLEASGRSPNPAGCVHLTRCAAVAPSDPWWARCRSEAPALRSIEAEHAVACHRATPKVP